MFSSKVSGLDSLLTFYEYQEGTFNLLHRCQHTLPGELLCEYEGGGGGTSGQAWRFFC
jgi:hypothetical protein